MRLTKADIAALIPHAGKMCLLESVTQWDTHTIRCMSTTHRDVDNPLRCAGRLPAMCGIEYATQAMAVHGGLINAVAHRPRAGYLASVRDVVCHRSYLDDLQGDLVVDASLLMGDGQRVVYEFTVSVGQMEVLSGRAAVVLDAGDSEAVAP